MSIPFRRRSTPKNWPSLMSDRSFDEILKNAKDSLLKSGIDNAGQEALWLLSYVTGQTVSEIKLGKNKCLSADEYEIFQNYLSDRISGVPLSRVLGVQEFWGLEFELNRTTLDPRQDTELIPELVTQKFSKEFDGTLLDLGTGSGCIALSILSEFPKARGIGIDISYEAAQQARKNAARNNLDKRFTVLNGHWCDALSGKYPLIVTNPPYIRGKDINSLDSAVRDYDPIPALDGGADGLDCVRQILYDLKNHLSPSGLAFMEIGYSQSDDVTRLIEKSGLRANDVHLDPAGIPRVVEISYGDK